MTLCKSCLLGWWSWYTRQCACTEQFNWDFLHNSCYYYVCLQRTPSSWYFNGGHSYGQALFSSLRLVKDSGLVVINLINLENADVLFCSITHTNHIIQYIRKEYRQNTGDVDLLPCYNYYSSENILFFLTIWKSDLFSIILWVNPLLIQCINITDYESTKVISQFWVTVKNC